LNSRGSQQESDMSDADIFFCWEVHLLHCWNIVTSRLAQLLCFWPCIGKVLGSNLGRTPSNPVLGVSEFYSDPPDKSHNIDLATSASSQILRRFSSYRSTLQNPDTVRVVRNNPSSTF
jgi:hypothetical protein